MKVMQNIVLAIYYFWPILLAVLDLLNHCSDLSFCQVKVAAVVIVVVGCVPLLWIGLSLQRIADRGLISLVPQVRFLPPALCNVTDLFSWRLIMFRYLLEKRQQCWTCQAEFMASTSNQFTDSQHSSPFYSSRWAWLAFLKCWMKSGHVKNEIEKAHKPLRVANGWAAILLLFTIFSCDAQSQEARRLRRVGWQPVYQQVQEKHITELPALSDSEFKRLQDYLRNAKAQREKNRPAQQGDYQWEGGYVFHPAFGEYQPLYYKGKGVGGLFAPGTKWANEYHRFSEDGGVFSTKSEPPVELRPVRTIEASTTKEPQKPSNNFSNDALTEVNAERAKRGLKPFIHDALLTQGALACAKARAASHIHGHLSSDFDYLPSGAQATAAGCGALEPSWGWGTCCVFDSYTYAGAAWVMGSDGRRYMHIFCR